MAPLTLDLSSLARRESLGDPSELYIRASRIPAMCPREEVLVHDNRVQRSSSVSVTLALSFAAGHGYHDAIREHVLPRLGVLVGSWRCVDCGASYGDPREPVPLRVEDGVAPPALESFLVPRPDVCSGCGGDNLRFRELKYAAPEYHTGGSPDGYIRLSPGSENAGIPYRVGLGLWELKTTAVPWDVRSSPFLAHMIQVQTYLWFTGLGWAVILYWVKGMDESNHAQVLVAHLVDRDEVTIAAIREALAAVRDGVNGGPLPGRICDEPSCARAKECAVRARCFSLPDRPDAAQEEGEPEEDPATGDDRWSAPEPVADLAAEEVVF